MELKEFIEKLSNKLSPAGLLILYCINYNDKKSFEKLNKIYGESVISNILSILQSELYIRIAGDSFESLILRQKALDLFKIDKYEAKVTEVLNYLNRKLNKSRGFKIDSNANRKFINARLHEGYDVVDLIKVIDVKYKQWYGTTNEFYLRPSTLFNNEKFASYIIQADNDRRDTKESSIFSLSGEN